MAQLDDFVDGISIHLGNSDASNVPRIAVVFAARQALKKLCDESFAYIVNAFDPLIDIDRPLTDSDLSLTRLNKRCELNLPANTHIIKVWRLTDNRCEHERWLDSAEYGYPNIINLDDKQRHTDNVVVSLSVAQTTEECPDYLFNKYYDGLLSGTIAYLQMMPNREWAVPNLAQDHYALFERAIQKAKSDVSNGFLKDRPMNEIPASFG